jgi:hypothetical protein
VDVGEDQVRVALEAVVHAVAVVGVDVHVRNTLQSVIPAQHFHRHAAVVEHAESGRGTTRRVMKTGDRNEGAARPARHDLFGGEQRGAYHVGGGFIHAAPRRRVAGIEETLTGERRFRDQFQVLRRVEGLQFFAGGRARFHDAHPLVEPARGEFGKKGGVAVLAEWMPVAKAVSRQTFSGDQQNGWARHG